MIKGTVGFLPFYLELYDRIFPQKLDDFRDFIEAVIGALHLRGFKVIEAPVCRLKAEFEDAVKLFENSGAEAVLTLHLAYSPSLEAVDALAGTSLPLVLLDTTRTYDFGPGQDPGEIMYNHGIHGVQDLCNLLLRRGRKFALEAGHWLESDVMDRAAEWLGAAALASRLKRARVGRIGRAFNGMGDFYLPDDKLASLLGIRVLQWPDMPVRTGADDDARIADGEMERDRARYGIGPDMEPLYEASARTGASVRSWIEREQLTAFTFNFLDINQSMNFETVPFLEASKSMARGIGYAGEGDTLTAAFIGALTGIWPETTFTEMFCPDWKNDMIFVSHMAEVNINLLVEATLHEMDYPYSDVPKNPVAIAGRLRGGNAVIANLAPSAGDAFTLTVAPVEVLEICGADHFPKSVHGWIKPRIPVPRFLEAYSRVGGTHHAALVYGDAARILEKFGILMGWNTVLIS